MDFSNMDEGHEDGKEVLHYYFNHEERIKRAPKIVRDYYSGEGIQSPKGILKSLVATKANRFGLFAIAIFCAFIYVYSLVSEKPYRKTVGGAEATLAAFSYADEIYASLTVRNGNDKADAIKHGTVTVRFSSIDVQKAIVGESENVQNYTGEELSVRTKFPDYDIVAVRAEIRFRGETKTLVARVVRE